MLTRPPAQMISVPGAEDESAVVVKEGVLRAGEEEAAGISEIESGQYDDSTGVLTLQFSNGQELSVKGFPTLNDIPEGEQGPQGEPGEPGEEGRDGRDGEKGEQGCKGETGDKGEQGDTGDDGRPGQPGAPGARGCPGPAGKRGKQGPTGPTGPVGPTGPTGEPGPPGEKGPKGEPGKLNVIFSTIDPGNVEPGTLWVNPSIGA